MGEAYYALGMAYQAARQPELAQKAFRQAEQLGGTLDAGSGAPAPEHATTATMITRIMLLLAAVSGVVLAAQSSPTTLVPPASPHAAPNVSYADVTTAAGLAGFRHVSGTADKAYLIETTGSGVAMADFDNDGLVDIYLVNGSTLDRVLSGSPAPRAALFHNNGNGTFRDTTESAGVINERWGQGVCVGDFDNDGTEDFYVANFGPNRLYHGLGDGRFTDIAVSAGVAVDSWSTGCAFGDYDGDGWLDLYVAGYVDFDAKNPPPAPSGAEAPRCHRRNRRHRRVGRRNGRIVHGWRDSVHLSQGTRHVRSAGAQRRARPPVSQQPRWHVHRRHREAGVTDTKRLYGFGVAWFDMDDDGHLDLIVANDSGPNYVYRNLGNGKFEDVSYPSGAALDGNGRDQAHMGVAIGDYDNDGRDDIHITNFADDFNVLYRNHDGTSFNDVSFKAGLAQVSIPFLGWGTDFLDYDNDGWRDLLVVNGHVYPMADRFDWNTTYAQRALLWRNLEGKRFEEIGAAAGPAVTTPRVARGSAVGDFDNDGGIDFVVNTIDGPPLLARNEGTGRGHWLRCSFAAIPRSKCPRDAIGSVVFVTAGGLRMRGEVASGRGQASQSDLRVHFGLGARRKSRRSKYVGRTVRR